MARQVGDRITFRQAHPKPKAQPKAKPFVGFKPVSAPSFGQKKAQQKVNRAAARLPQSKTPLPAIPKLAHPTHAQREEALTLTSKAIQPKRLPGETAQHALTRLSRTGTKQVKGQTKQTTKNVRALVTPKQRLALQQIAAGPTAKEGPKPTKVSIAGVNILPGLKAAEHKLGTGLMPAGQVLRFATLPANVIAGAAQGKSPKQSINEQPSFYDLLKKVTPKKFQHSGVEKAALAGAGTALDIGTDPTTYLTLGAGVPEEVAAKAAAHAAEEKGARSLADTGISVGARVHVPFTGKTFEKATSGKASRKALQTLSTPGTKKVGKAVKGELRHVAPDLTPNFRTAVEHKVIREAERRYRSAIREGEGKIGRHVTAYQKALKGQNAENVVNAIERAPKHLSQYRSYEEAAQKHEALTRLERGAMKARVRLEQIAKERPLTDAEQKALGRARRRATTFGDQTTAAGKVLSIQRGNLNANRFDLSSLNEQEQAVARKVISDFQDELQQKASRDLGAGTFKPTGPEDAQRYFPHVNSKKFEEGSKSARRAFPTLKAAAEKGRGIRKPIAVTNQETPGLFETSIPKAVGQKLAETNRAAATHDLWQRVASTGRPVTNDTLGHLTEDDLQHTRIYEVTPRGLTTVEDAHGGFDKKAAVEIASGKRKGHFVLLDRRSVEDVEKRLASSGVAETGIGRFLDRTTGRLKYAATILNPSFMPRNALGDSINAFMGEARGKGFTEAAQMMRVERAKNAYEKSAESILNPETPEHLQRLLDRKLHFPSGTQTYGELLDEMRHEGAIDTGQFGAELRNMLGQEGEAALGKSYRVRAINEYRENVIRATTYVSAKLRGMSPSEAAAWSLKHHFDYSDLSPFERNVARRLFPFWTFFARNTRLQAEKLLTRPGRLATIGKVLNNAAKVAGYQSYQQYSQHLTDSQKQGLPVPIKVNGVTFNTYLSPPTTDLNQLSLSPHTQFFNVIQRFTFYKTIPELLMNYSWFFRGQIQNPQAPLVPAPSPAADLPSPLKKALGITMYVDKRSGKRIVGWPAKVDYAFRQITPDVNTALQLATPVPGSRGMSQRTQALSALTGIRVAPLDDTTNRINQLYQQLNNATNQLDALNQRLGKDPDGHYPQPPESKKLRAQIKTLNQKIGQLKSQRGDNPSGIATQQRPKASGGSVLDQSGATTTKSVLDAPSNTRSTSVLDR